jgi:hypothetical protein
MAMEWTDTTIAARVVAPGKFTDRNGQRNGRPAIVITTGDDDGVIIEGSRGDLLDWLAATTETVLASNRAVMP